MFVWWMMACSPNPSAEGPSRDRLPQEWLPIQGPRLALSIAQERSGLLVDPLTLDLFLVTRDSGANAPLYYIEL